MSLQSKTQTFNMSEHLLHNNAPNSDSRTHRADIYRWLCRLWLKGPLGNPPHTDICNCLSGWCRFGCRCPGWYTHQCLKKRRGAKKRHMKQEKCWDTVHRSNEIPLSRSTWRVCIRVNTLLAAFNVTEVRISKKTERAHKRRRFADSYWTVYI